MPKVRKQGAPEFIDPLEQKLYNVLSNALRREECAARAAARLEFDIVQQYQRDKTTPTVSPNGVEDDTGPSETRDFATSQFQELFGAINLLRTVSELTALLELENRTDEITTVMIHDMFKKPSNPVPVGHRSVKPAEQNERTYIGTDFEVLLDRIREAASVRNKKKKQ